MEQEDSKNVENEISKDDDNSFIENMKEDEEDIEEMDEEID